jgi:hypothetical protein
MNPPCDSDDAAARPASPRPLFEEPPSVAFAALVMFAQAVTALVVTVTLIGILFGVR